MAWSVTIPGGSTWTDVDFEPFTYPESFPAIIQEFITYAESTEAVVKAGEAAASATAAAASATAAAGSATTASAGATTATTKAGEASASATAAAGSATTASTGATTATTQAGIATTGANTATSQAAISTASAVTSTAAKDAALVAQAAASASAGGAATSETNAATSAASAATSAAQAAVSAGVAGSGPATTLLYPALNKVTITATDIVDGIVYTPRSQDTDGGDWRFRCEHTSHFAATLNTATRGAKREFPAVADITVRSGTTATLQIQDRTDLDVSGVPRMWWILARSTGGLLDGTPTAVAAQQGRVCVTTSTGLYVYDFPNDRAFRYDAAGVYLWSGGIMAASGSWRLVAASGAIVSATANHADLRVLPNAPLDAAGLPIPTVLVSTAAGASVIHPNGAVYDITCATGILRGRILEDGRISIQRLNQAVTAFGPMPYADVADSSWWTYYLDAATGSLAIISSSSTALSKDAIGGSQGLNLIAEDLGNPANGMTARVAINYATGWMPGQGIRGAYLCDATTGNITGSTLFSDGFSSYADTAAMLAVWTDASVGTGTATLSSGAASLTRTDGSNKGEIRRSMTTVAGQTYAVAVDITGGVFVSVGTSAGGAQLLAAVSLTGASTQVQFTATGTTAWLNLNAANTGTNTIDNVSVKLAVPDRSFRGKGLIPVGTLSRTAVAAGSDMVAFSGFSNSNYLTQPYNADLDFGTGDFMVAGWFTVPDLIANRTVVQRGATGAARFEVISVVGALRFDISDGTNTAVTSTSASGLTAGALTHFVAVVRSGVMELWLNGVRVAIQSRGSVGSISSASSALLVGVRNSAGLSADLGAGSISLLRFSAYAPTPAQIARMYRDELALVQPGVKCLLGGTSNAVADMDFDTTRNELIVGTADGVSEFSGLVRTSYLDTSNTTLTNDNMRAVASQAGYRLLAGGAQVVAQRDAVNGIDEMTRMRPPSVERFIMRGVTTDATPTNLAPRILVGERELVRVRATVAARQNGAAGTERASYDIVTQAYRDAGGNVTLDIAAANQGVAGWGTAGPAAITRAQETTSTMDAVWVVDTASQTLTIQVTGKSATRLEWVASNIAIERIASETLYALVAA